MFAMNNESHIRSRSGYKRIFLEKLSERLSVQTGLQLGFMEESKYKVNHPQSTVLVSKNTSGRSCENFWIPVIKGILPHNPQWHRDSTFF